MDITINETIDECLKSALKKTKILTIYDENTVKP